MEVIAIQGMAMGTIISFGTLTVEDPSDPALTRVAWPLVGTTYHDGAHPAHGPPWQRSLNARAWARWRQWPAVRAILAYCQIPAEVDNRFSHPIDDELLRLINVLYARARRWAWVPKVGRVGLDRAKWLHDWAHRARDEFGDRAYIGFQ